jgi:hypothetical protein
MNAETTLKNAIAAGFDRLSERDVMLCVLEGAGGGATGSGVLTGSGSPVGVVTPTSVGQLYTDTTTPGEWLSTGLTNASWTQLI